MARPGGRIEPVEGVREAYLDDLAGDFRMTRPLRVVCATGNGTAGAFAPELLRRIGVEVVERHTALDDTFPHYNPNPEALEMLHDMADAVRESGADLALGFDGDGDRCGVVDGAGDEIFADKMGVILARDLARLHPGATFVADVKSTGLFASDPVLRGAGRQGGLLEDRAQPHETARRGVGRARRVREVGALFLRAAGGARLRLRDAGGGGDLPADGAEPGPEPRRSQRRPAPDLDDADAVAVLSGRREIRRDRAADPAAGGAGRVGRARLGGRAITSVVTVNGARVMLENGGWGLVRASSNTPNLVVVCESPDSEAEMRAIFADLDALIREEPSVGAYDQTI